jgi:hypothetical protein
MRSAREREIVGIAAGAAQERFVFKARKALT